MSNIAKRQGRMIRKGKEVRFGSVHIDLIGPIELLNNREAKGAAIDFLRTEILASKDWLKDCAKISPSLKRFRLISIRTYICIRFQDKTDFALEFSQQIVRVGTELCDSATDDFDVILNYYQEQRE